MSRERNIPPRELLEKWKKEDEEARRIRRESADWNFINKQAPHIRAALIYFIEQGDRYVAARIAGLTIEEFDEIRRKAKIPVVI
ncbi:MAG: hypothetical protein DRJ66_07380 [Thermoprotei archaeon]|nr:MAG: hypothetical protein DRJ66_07380 [Thermoprotei archaeon]RLF17877.1 MAG: hypothetical protein DRZ82_09290 [Thermoprotei archaeon]